MASPQLENGYTKIANEIMDALIAYRLPGEQRQVLDFILRKTYGYNKIWDSISNSQFVKATGLKKPNVCRAINELIAKRIVIKIDNKAIPTYRFNKDYRLWQKLSKMITKKQESSNNEHPGESVIKIDNEKLLSKLIPTKDNNIYNNKTDFKFEKLVPIPKDIFLTDRMKEYVQKQGCDDLNHAKNLFEDFCINHKKRGTKWKDWTATFYTWVRNDKKIYHPNHYKQKEYI
uniref:Replication protein n=1 Tax=Candidatus Desulfatibia profunda TaxID=2841695 RepID=A0A8J6NQ40_9BACT|nr:replication protein [Candidatus Desulfatibia profunda]